jgi:predicted flavoprotein YhiN
MVNDRVIVIGAGASGMMAAGRAAESGADVLLLEKMPQAGKKLLISGKSRCNLTNSRDLEDFILMYGPNGRFLYSAFHRFFRDEMLLLLKRYGIETTTERGGRIFPASGDAGDVVKALRDYITAHKVQYHPNSRTTAIDVVDRCITGVHTEGAYYPARAVILATGGASYPGTGSTGDGFKIAATLGHTIIPLRPALVPLVVKEMQLARSMQGVSLRNIRMTAIRGHTSDINGIPMPIKDKGRGMVRESPGKAIIESRLGEMMLTHFGIGGPITLQMSLAIVDALKQGPVSVSIDLKPALNEDRLHQRVQREFDQHPRKSYRHILEALLPRKMIEPYVQMTGIPPDKRGNQVTSEERTRLVARLKSLKFNIEKPLPLTSAMVTAGGISLAEIEPRTMASRLIQGLYLCGEVMDIDADTGGYNLQAAFSTGYVAGEHAARYTAGNDNERDV